MKTAPFTGDYGWTNKYVGAVVFCLVAGFVAFLAAEMTDRARSAGGRGAMVYGVAPAVPAEAFGHSVPLYGEDGRA
jgi:uncharacterized membrane protein